MTADADASPPRDRSVSSSRRAAVWLATGLGVGLVAPAPGTVGGLWGLPVALATMQLPGYLWQGVAIVVIGAIGVWLCGMASRALGSSDPQPVVLDEIAALPIVFWGLSGIGNGTLIAGFALFRVFDITKPGIVKRGERLPGGLGVMADDWLAALHAWAALRLLLWVDHSAGWGFFV